MIDTLRSTCRGLAAAPTRLDELLAGVDELPSACNVEAATLLVQLVKLGDGLDKTGSRLEKLAEQLAAPLFDGNGARAKPPQGKGGRK
jgi:hypothetical protein